MRSLMVLKVCLISTTGGHLVQILMLKEVYENLDHYFVTVQNEFSEHVLDRDKKYYVTQILRNLGKLILNGLESLRVLRRERPAVIITTGAGDVLPTCLLGKIMGCKIVFLETFARVREPSLVGRLLAPFADMVIVQWKSMLDHYKNAVCSGPIFNVSKLEQIPDDPKVFIATGTHTASFHRLLKFADELAERGEISVTSSQIGHSSYEPENFPWARFLPWEAFQHSLRNSDIVLTHDGASSIGLALSFGKRVVVVPRKKQFGEVGYASKHDLARYLADEGLVVLVEDVQDIPKGISKAAGMTDSKEVLPGRGPAEVIDEYLTEIQSSG